jgi:predicted 2-oxoglutarate/Fe(II)-dependent dioxygenase YbiX
MTSANIEYYEFDKNIYVYKNLIKNPERLVELLKESELNPSSSFIFSNWGKWAEFGTYMSPGSGVPLHFHDVELENDERYLEENAFNEQVLNAFKISTKHFLNEHNIEIGEDWLTMGPSYCRYDQNVVVHKNDIAGDLSMTYHTDYQWMEFDSPMPKFALTCTMYLNDDYEGGDVVFKMMHDEGRMPYKPKAGDVMVFPSGHPKLLSDNDIYFHAVKEVTKNDKYFIRYFYLFPNKASQEWLELEKEHGLEKWKQIYEQTIVPVRRREGLNDNNRKLR